MDHKAGSDVNGRQVCAASHVFATTPRIAHLIYAVRYHQEESYAAMKNPRLFDLVEYELGIKAQEVRQAGDRVL